MRFQYRQGCYRPPQHRHQEFSRALSRRLTSRNVHPLQSAPLTTNKQAKTSCLYAPCEESGSSWNDLGKPAPVARIDTGAKIPTQHDTTHHNGEDDSTGLEFEGLDVETNDTSSGKGGLHSGGITRVALLPYQKSWARAYLIALGNRETTTPCPASHPRRRQAFPMRRGQS